MASRPEAQTTRKHVERAGLAALLGRLFVLAICAACAGCCGETSRQTAAPSPAPAPSTSSGGERQGAVLHGEASYYGRALNGRRTASGERYDPNAYTAANRTLPFGTRLKVTRVDNGKFVVVRVNDRGPFGHRRRILDLSRKAAKDLGMISDGLIEVEAEVLR